MPNSPWNPLHTKLDMSDVLPVALIGMNAKLVCQYIEFVADCLLMLLGSDKVCNVMDPFDIMDMISIQGKINFFNKHVSDYFKANVNHNSKNGAVASCCIDHAMHYYRVCQNCAGILDR